MITAGFSHDEASGDSSFNDRCSGRGARGEDRGSDACSAFVISGNFFCDGIYGTGFNQRHAAASEASAGHAAAIDPALLSDGFGDLHDRIEFRTADFVVIPQSRMTCCHQSPHGGPIGLADTLRRLHRALDFADDMTSTAVNSFGHFTFPGFELASGHITERCHAEVPDGFLALCPTLGVFAAAELVLHVGVNDQ